MEVQKICLQKGDLNNMEKRKDIDMLRFYGGDIHQKNKEGEYVITNNLVNPKNKEDVLWGDRDAYRTLNALLFDGIENEKERIYKEKRKLNPVFIELIENTLEIYRGIFAVMCRKKGNQLSVSKVKRVDRKASLMAYLKGHTESFVSCTNGEYDDEFASKNNIILLEIESLENTPYVDYQQVITMQEYCNYDEKEVLFPPFLSLNVSEIELTTKVIYKQLDRIQQLIEKMEPTDIRVKHRECYLGNRCLFDKGNYANRWKMLEDKKLSVVKEIFDEYGSEEVERFGCAVKNVHDVANKLGRFLRPNEMSSIIEKYFIGILSKEFTINCLISFVYTQGAEKLLETSLCQMEDEFMLEILSKIPFSLQLLDVINQVLDDDTAYWEKGAMPYSCYDAEELKIIVEKLVACKRYVTAVNIIGHSECEAVINAECIYKLMKLAGTEESIGVETLDDYAVQKIIGWFQQQEDIDLELRSDIEFIYLPMLDEYSEVRPRALNTRLSLEPEYFCSLIELFYKERNGEKREIELNKSLSDRLYEILFQFKVIPGIDWNGNFDAKRFDYWMKTVKT